jgi:hypothetical protein
MDLSARISRKSRTAVGSTTSQGDQAVELFNRAGAPQNFSKNLSKTLDNQI